MSVKDASNRRKLEIVRDILYNYLDNKEIEPMMKETKIYRELERVLPRSSIVFSDSEVFNRFKNLCSARIRNIMVLSDSLHSS